MTKLLFLSLGTSFILSACASSSQAPAFEQAHALPIMVTPEAEPKAYDNSVLAASIDAQQQRIEALEFELAKLQTQVNALSPPLSAPTPIPTKAKPEPIANPDEQFYTQAQGLLRRKEYVSMVNLLKGYANGGNGDSMAQNNMYLLGVAHFNLGNCDAAIGINRRFANDYKQHPKAPSALYNIANCQLSMKQNDVANSTLRSLIRSYPNSTEAQRAKILLK
ncbi:MAG: tetratricopeptide repeat protein [Neisseriaceae bacterium]|nr:tetratricopeptide repeat protein [Neisseriaceae bacterium]MBP6861828.1 tetratricopeptide repeat protein [Neisseriaceae bacterium]